MSDAAQQPRSAAAIVGLVLGIIAIIISWVPIVNNLAFIVGAVGLVFSIVAMVGTMRKKKAGKGLAIAALVANIASIAIVLGTQSMYGAAIDDALDAPAASTATAPGDDADAEVPATTDEGDAQEFTNLAVGTSVELENGLSVTVDAVQTGLVNYDGSSVVGIQVTYVNNGDAGADYNSYDWKGQDGQGAQESSTYYADGTNELSYGTLDAGGSVTGNIYFAGDTVMALYFGNVFADSPAASWAIA